MRKNEGLLFKVSMGLVFLKATDQVTGVQGYPCMEGGPCSLGPVMPPGFAPSQAQDRLAANEVRPSPAI